MPDHPQSQSLPPHWERRDKPPMLNRRFVFGSYGETRRFLDALAEMSEATGIHPNNISFGTTYVNITLDAQDGKALSADDIGLACQIEAVFEAQGKDKA